MKIQTNIQGADGRGRCEQQKRVVADFPWYLYDAVNDSRTRPSHAAMDGLVARHDDSIWATWTPLVGYQCRCRRIALTEKQAQRFITADQRRLQDPDVADARAKAQPDPGWDYNPCAEPDEGLRRAIERKRQECLDAEFAAKRGGRKLWCQGQLNHELDVLAAALDHDAPMPEPRRLDSPLLPPGQDERFYLERFMRLFGEELNGTAMIEAPTGHRLSVSRLLFTDHSRKPPLGTLRSAI